MSATPMQPSPAATPPSLECRACRGAAGRVAPAPVSAQVRAPVRAQVRARAPVRARARPRRAAAAAAAVLLGLALQALVAAPPLAAQIPVTDAAHIAVNAYWHYLHYLQAAWQIYQQAVQIQQQVRQLEAQLRALKKLRDPNWRQIADLLFELDGLVASGRSLGYALADVGGQFRQTYPGWTRWQDPAAAPLQAERALDTFRAGLAAVSRQTRTLAAGEQTLAAVRRQMTSTDGHQQALEQLATLAAFSAQEQLLARQSLAVAANLDAVAQGFWVNRQAQADATFHDVAFETSLAGPRSTSPGFTFQPPWLLP
jgi:P-type conjugative transfer protein TrbJ